MGVLMSKRDKKPYTDLKQTSENSTPPVEQPKELEALSNLPVDVQEKLKTIKTKVLYILIILV